jgi:tRNA(Arg) A34 adenosine deaminase TadA
MPLISQGQAVPDDYFASPANRDALLQKLIALPCGIEATDSKPRILGKIADYLESYVPDSRYADDEAARASVLWALKGVQEGGYGIGAVIAHREAGLLHGAYNAQLQRGRSDLHGEMNLLNQFEDDPAYSKYLNRRAFTGGERSFYDSDLLVVSSAEPCPMCFVRLSIAGVATKYVTPGPDDGMTERADSLPPFWAALAKQNSFERADASPVLQKLAHVLFFSYLL